MRDSVSQTVHHGAENARITCNPPLTITEAQLNEGFAIIDRGLEITDAAFEG